MTQHSDLSTEGGGGNCQGVNFRMQQLLLDIQLIKVACNSDENCPFESKICIFRMNKIQIEYSINSVMFNCSFQSFVINYIIYLDIVIVWVEMSENQLP